MNLICSYQIKNSLVLALLIPALLFANKNIHFEHLTQSDGLPSNDVGKIFQDSDGLMWFATYSGLASFDGYTFREFNYSPTDSNTINHDLVLSIAEENERFLWIGTFRGLCRYDKDLDKINRYSVDELGGLANQSIKKIVFDKENNILLGTTGGLVIYNMKMGISHTYTHNPDDTGTISAGSILDLYIDSLNQVWIGTRNGLDLFDRNTETFTHLFSDQEFERIIPYHGGILAVTRFFKRYYTPSVTNLNFEEIQFTEDNPGFVFTDILTNYQDAEWYAIREYGILVEKLGTDQIINYSFSKYNTNGINSNVPQCLFVDKDSNLWIGTFDGGVNFYSPHRKVFHNLKDNFLESGLANNKVKTIFQDRDGDIWVGTKVGGTLSRFDLEKETFTHFCHDPNDPESISDDYIFSITDAEPGYLWVGTMTGGVNHFNKKTGKCEVYKHDPEDEKSITGNNIKTLYVDNDILWISLHRLGIDKFDIKKGEKIKNYHFEEGVAGNIPSNTIYEIFKDSKGTFWFATFYGLSRYDTISDSFVNYNFNEFDSTSLSDNIIFCIYEDSEKNLWIGTKNGLNKYNHASDDFTVFNTNTGLPTNAIYGLSSDKNGDLWISTNIGLCRFNWKSEESRLYTVEDGLSNNEFLPGVYETIEEGYIFFGGNEGFTYFKPENIRDNPIIPKLLFTDFKIFNKSVKVGDHNNVLDKHISRVEQIKLKHKQSVFSIEFTALNYNSTAKNQYAYMMEGFDEDWQYVGSVRTATYTNLNPGNYVFHAKASNNDGLWNEDGIELSITILPRWFQTLIFRITLVIFIISLIIGIYYLRLNQLNRQKILLARQVKERTREIEEKNIILQKQASELNEINIRLEDRQLKVEEQSEELRSQAEKLSTTNKMLIKLNATKDKFFSIIAHDLKNPFNAILGFCEVLNLRYDQYDDERRKKLINGIDISSQNIYRLLENLLQWARSQTGMIEYSPEKIVLTEIVDNIKSLVFNKLKEKKLELGIDIPPEYTVYTDKNMLSTIIRNLITNAIKFTEKGVITVKVADMKKVTVISVIDTGIGIDNDAKDRIFDIDRSKSTPDTRGDTGTGLGLIICKDFVEKLGGTIDVKSTLNKGSEFFFSIPKKDDTKK